MGGIDALFAGPGIYEIHRTRSRNSLERVYETNRQRGASLEYRGCVEPGADGEGAAILVANFGTRHNSNANRQRNKESQGEVLLVTGGQFFPEGLNHLEIWPAQAARFAPHNRV